METDALVEAALTKVCQTINQTHHSISLTDRKSRIAKAINAVDALKSALKAL